MRSVRRLYLPGVCYFFTVVTYQRLPLLCSEFAINRLRVAFRLTMQKYPFHMQSIVVLPDHIHCLWQLPKKDSDFSTRWHHIKRYFSIGINNLKSEERQKIWQRRFWDHLIRDEVDWQRHLDYINYNPVRHGLVSRPFDWLYSSFKRDVALGFYDAEWGNKMPRNIEDMDYE